MNKAMTILVMFQLAIAGCASSNPELRPQMDASAEPGTVLIYRTESVQATLANAYIGLGDNYFIELDEDQYTEFQLEPGFHQFKARAHGSVASESQIKVQAGEMLCIEARPNHEELEWLAVPFLNALIPSFVLTETPCPSSEMLGDLNAV